MSDQLQMFGRETSKATSSYISSVASQDGRSRSDSQDGQKKGKSGPEAVPVSRFRARDQGKAMPTNDTCGPLFNASSPSADLQRCLESRLRARMDVNGSPEYELTWKEADMPSGLPICALRASGRRTSGKGFTGWPTPNLDDCDNVTRASGEFSSLTRTANLSGWPTPNAPSGGRSVSPDTMDATGKTRDGRKHTASLEHAVKFSGWASPCVNDQTGSQYAYSQGNHDRPVLKLPGQAQLTSGPTPSGTSAETVKHDASRLVLNPFFSAWLQGFPKEWTLSGLRALASRSRRASKAGSDSCAVSETPSTPNSRRRSSKP